LFYIDETGEHGLVAALGDIGAAFPWGCQWTEISGADAQFVGSGLQNSLDIIAGCTEVSIAGSVALNTSIDGYSDWYLPSILELKEMHNSIGPGSSDADIAGLGNDSYWSSSESGDQFALCFYCNHGGYLSKYKSSMHLVRTVRAF